jgi:hypothetical protein
MGVAPFSGTNTSMGRLYSSEMACISGLLPWTPSCRFLRIYSSNASSFTNCEKCATSLAYSSSKRETERKRTFEIWIYKCR